jgi:hypothetical protein
MTSRRRQSRTQRIELVVQPLLSHFAVGHQPAAMPHRGTQRLHRALLTVPSTATLTCQVRQRRAVPVVSLEPARTQLRTSRFGLRRREQPDRARMAAFQFSDPGSVQTARRLDRDHRRVRPMFVQRQIQLGDAFSRNRQRHRSGQHPRAVTNPHPMERFTWIYSDDHRRRIKRNPQHRHEQPPLNRTLHRESAQPLLMAYQPEVSGVGLSPDSHLDSIAWVTTVPAGISFWKVSPSSSSKVMV